LKPCTFETLRQCSAAAEIIERDSSPEGRRKTNRVPLWDGHASERIAQIIVRASAT
jgi:hypothetical protein